MFSSESLTAAVTAAVATVIGVFLVAALMDMYYVHKEFGGVERIEFQGPTSENVYFLTRLAILYVIANAVVFPLSATMSADPYRSATLPEAAAHFGLEVGKEYPLEIGSRVAGTSGEANIRSGLFYASSHARWKPSSSVSLGFENSSGKSWVLEIPMSQITFEKAASDDAESSMIVYLDEGASAPYADFEVEIEYTGCRPRFLWGWWLCDSDVTTENLVVTDEAERRGLAAIINGPDTSVVITLTPEAYEKLLHGGQ